MGRWVIKGLVAFSVLISAYMVSSQLLFEYGQDKTADEWCKAHNLATYNQLRSRDICIDPKTRVAVIPE